MSKTFQLSLAPQNLWQAINPWTFNQQGAQFGFVNIDLGQTPHPETERTILDEVGSYGRQLGRIGDRARSASKACHARWAEPERAGRPGDPAGPACRHQAGEATRPGKRLVRWLARLEPPPATAALCPPPAPEHRSWRPRYLNAARRIPGRKRRRRTPASPLTWRRSSRPAYAPACCATCTPSLSVAPAAWCWNATTTARMRAGTTPLGRISFGPATLHDLRSVTKSVVSLLYGIALDQGLVPPADAPLLAQFPEYPRSRRRSAARAAPHRPRSDHDAGHGVDEQRPYTDPANSEIAMERAPDRTRFILDRPIIAEPGARWSYSGGAVALLGALIARGAGATLPEFARRVLFEPLGISSFEWMAGRDGVASPRPGCACVRATCFASAPWCWPGAVGRSSHRVARLAGGVVPGRGPDRRRA